MYINKTAFMNGIGLAISNTSKILAENVHLTIELNYNPALNILDEYDMPALPSTHTISIPKFHTVDRLQEKALIEAKRYGDLWVITSDFGNIQPGATVWTKEVFYIGAKEASKIEMNVHVVANNLIEPLEMILTINIDVTSRSLQIEDINKFIESNE